MFHVIFSRNEPTLLTIKTVIRSSLFSVRQSNHIAAFSPRCGKYVYHEPIATLEKKAA